jgi:uncharacterized Zn finger protein
VPVAQRKAQAAAKLKKLEKKGARLQPVVLQSRKIAATFWGKAWCDNLESYMDFENRLPRGRSYVRNGSVLHLEIKPGAIEAKVAGSSLYTIKIQIKPAAPAKWKQLCKECAGQIGSLLELLSGRLSERVMGVMTRKESGLFPAPKEIKLDCSCPDWATMCKHVAAVFYGVGARLDAQPELLFLLRSVDHSDLVSQAVAADITSGHGAIEPETLAATDLADVFGIEIDKSDPPHPVAKKPAARIVAVKKSAASGMKPLGRIRKAAAAPLYGPAKKTRKCPRDGKGQSVCAPAAGLISKGRATKQSMT